MYQKILLACCCSLLLWGCKKDKDKLVNVNIEDDFYIDMFEDVSNGERRFELELTTIQEQTCLNYTIDYSLYFDEASNAIELSINDLVEPELCLQGTAPVSIVVPFGTMNTGTYTFNINLKDAVINEGKLRVINDYYALEMDSDDGVDIINETLYRIPQKTIWGSVAFDNDNQEAAGQDFITDLKNIGTVTSVEESAAFQEGYYGYFDLDADKTITLHNVPVFSYHLPFIFRYDGDDLTAINDLLESTCQEYPALDIQLFLANGQELKCD